MQGFGPVEVEPDEPTFHGEWEARTFAVAGGALGAGGFNTPMFRHAIERMDPGHYLTSSYFEHWLTAVATLLVEAAMISKAELDARAGTFALSRPATVAPDDVQLVSGRHTPRFEVGDAVRVRDAHFGGHTRCPGYVRGKVGVVTRFDGEWNLPDVEAHSPERVPQALYSVRFSADELWGDGQPGVSVSVDLWDSYLEHG